MDCSFKIISYLSVSSVVLNVEIPRHLYLNKCNFYYPDFFLPNTYILCDHNKEKTPKKMLPF